MCSILAGDSFYPDNPDMVGDKDIPETPQTMLESRLSAQKIHRMEFISRHDVNVFCNFDLPHKQILPKHQDETLKNYYST